MAANGYGAGPVTGHVGRIPNYGRTQLNPMGNVEPPACIQNAMMTKDKKPFTYTPGGLDLSQIKCPSMARRMNRQRSQEEEHQQQYGPGPQMNGGGNQYQQGVPAPPPPPPQAPAPPPPPPLIIQAPKATSPNPIVPGVRPEIVIPENPIGMLRKTNSPYHWEAEQAELQRIGQVPKFVEKAPSPQNAQMPPSSFSQQPPQSYSQQNQNNQRQNLYSNQTPSSPVHKPEAQYANQNYSSVSSSPRPQEFNRGQNNQYSNSPHSFSPQSPVSNGSPFSPTPNSSWKQPERRDSPAAATNSPPIQFNRGQFSPNTQQYSPNQNQFNYNPSNNSSPAFHTLPKAQPKPQDNYLNNNTQNSNILYNNTNQNRPQSPRLDAVNSPPWRNTENKTPASQNIYHNSQPSQQQPNYCPPWKTAQQPSQNNQQSTPQWNQDNRNDNTNQAEKSVPSQNQQYVPPWVKDSNNNKVKEEYNPTWRNNENTQVKPQNQPEEQPRYQSSISIPVTPRAPKQDQQYNNQAPQREIVYVNQEPVYYCPDDQTVPPFVKSQKERTKTPPPVWCQRPLENRKSIPRDLTTPPRDNNQEPEWVKKSNEMQRNIRDVVSPPKYQQPQPTWSTKPSDNRKSLPKETPPTFDHHGRTIPIQIETEREPEKMRHAHPHLRISIGVPTQSPPSPQGPYSQPTQRIMRVLSPQLVRFDEGTTQPDLPSLNRNFESHENQPKTRIIPIQIEGASDGANKRVFHHKFTQEGPPRQSKSFRVLQIITGTGDNFQDMETNHGFTDL